MFLLKKFQFIFLVLRMATIITNKKVLLCERKRHTACHVASTPYVVLTGYPHPPAGYPHPDLAGGTPRQGTPWQDPPGRVPPSLDLVGGYPLQQGTPRQGTPQQDSPWQGTPWQGTPYRVPPLPPWLNLAGHPPTSWTWQGTPPPGVCPMAFWVMLQSIMGYGSPLPGVNKP